MSREKVNNFCVLDKNCPYSEQESCHDFRMDHERYSNYLNLL